MRVLVVGSGLLGVSSAWFLARSGCEVTVLDREREPAQGTSYANAGMLTPSMADPWNAPGMFWHLLRWIGREDAPFLVRPSALPPLLGWGLAFLAHSRPAAYRASMDKNLRLAAYSLEVTRELRAALTLRYDHLARGTIKVFRDVRAFEQAMARNRILAELGLDVRAVSPVQAAMIEPALMPVRDLLVGAIHCTADESGDARLFTQALADKCREAGVRFVFDAKVDAFVRDGDRVKAVTSGGAVHVADTFVIAAGSWSPLLFEQLDVDLPVRPVKGYSITVPMEGWNAAPKMPVVDDALHAAATPLGTRLRVAGTAEIAGYDTAPNPRRIDNLFELLLELFPSYAPLLDRSKAAPWAGLRPVSADGAPHIGQLGPRNVYVTTGHGHLGWTLAAGSGKLLADLVCGKAPDIAPAPYDPQR